MKILALSPFVLLLLLGAPAAAAGPVEEVQPLVQQFVRAYNEGNAEGIASAYAENAVWVPSGGPFYVQGRSAIQAAWTGFYQRFNARLVTRQPLLHAYGDNVVVSATYFTFISIEKASGKATTTHGRSTITRVKLDGKWQIVNHHASVLPSSP